MDYNYNHRVFRSAFWLFVAAAGIALYVSAPQAAAALVDSILGDAIDFIVAL